MQTYETLISEFRTDYQIAPYVVDGTLERFAKEGEAALSSLVLSADFETDLVARSLLKNYMYYALNHVTNEFWENYRNDVTQWQWEHDDSAGEDEEEDEG